MALNIYIGKENLPKDKLLIQNIDSAFKSVLLQDDSITCTILRVVEQAKYMDANTFEDRFGRRLFIDCLSMGTKALLLLKNEPEMVINGSILGVNAVSMLPLFDSGNIYFDVYDFNIQEFLDIDFSNLKMVINGIERIGISSINYALEGIYED